MNLIQLNHYRPAIAIFHPSTRPQLMQPDAGFLDHGQAGQPAARRLPQAGPARR
jgi:hypothetical protein